VEESISSIIKLGPEIIIVFRSSDARLLIASSSEGFCSVITFDEGEIGQEFIVNDQIPLGDSTPISRQSSVQILDDVTSTDQSEISIGVQGKVV